MSPRLGDVCGGRDNNFNLIRMVAASAVLVSHAFPVTRGWGAAEPFEGVLDRSLGSIAVFVFFAISGFLIARIPKEVADLEEQAGAGGPPLRQRQRVNVGLVLFVSQSLQVLLVALAVAIFFVVFGLLTIGAETVSSWTTHPADVFFEFTLAGREAAMTRELLRVATAIASFTGLYFAISMLTDDLYRREFLSRITDEMKQTFVRRIEYLKLLGKC